MQAVDENEDLENHIKWGLVSVRWHQL